MDEKKAVALDPGVRTFQTGFSESEFFESKINKTKYERLKNKIQLMQSLYSTNRNIKHRKKIFILHKKIKNLINECHCKLCKKQHLTLYVITMTSFFPVLRAKKW